MTTLERSDAEELDAGMVALPAWMYPGGLGCLAMHSYLQRGPDPVLFDTGPACLSDELVRQLDELVDLSELRWVWLTHADPDHTGGLGAVLERAPRAQVVTSFLGAGKLGLAGAVEPERVHLVEAGGTLDLVDRKLVAVRPPVYDAPETLGALDQRTGDFVAADAFGALLEAPCDLAEASSDERLAEGMARWAAIDTPWLELVDPLRFDASLCEFESLGVARVFGAHLPPSSDPRALVAALCSVCASARGTITAL